MVDFAKQATGSGLAVAIIGRSAPGAERLRDARTFSADKVAKSAQRVVAVILKPVSPLLRIAEHALRPAIVRPEP